MFVDVAVNAPVKITMQPYNTGAIFQNEIHEAGRTFTATISDSFLVHNVSANSLADAGVIIKRGAQQLAYAFEQARAKQYQDQNTSIQSATMDTSGSWGLTLLYSPAPQRNDPQIIKVQL